MVDVIKEDVAIKSFQFPTGKLVVGKDYVKFTSVTACSPSTASRRSPGDYKNELKAGDKIRIKGQAGILLLEKVSVLLLFFFVLFDLLLFV